MGPNINCATGGLAKHKFACYIRPNLSVFADQTEVIAMPLAHIRRSKFWLPLIVPALGLLSACTTSGGNIFSNAAPKSDQQGTQSASASTNGQNANAGTLNSGGNLRAYCPWLRIRAGTESYRVYQKGGGSLDDNLRYQATILKVARECNYVDGNLEIVMGARGRIISGPKGSAGSFDMPIRIAIQQGDCSRHFKLYKTPGAIEAGKSNGTFQFVSEKIVIPAPTAENVRMYLGYDPDTRSKPSTTNCA